MYINIPMNKNEKIILFFSFNINIIIIKLKKILIKNPIIKIKIKVIHTI